MQKEDGVGNSEHKETTKERKENGREGGVLLRDASF
jgi:hypothetical protein